MSQVHVLADSENWYRWQTVKNQKFAHLPLSGIIFSICIFLKGNPFLWDPLLFHFVSRLRLVVCLSVHSGHHYKIGPNCTSPSAPPNPGMFRLVHYNVRTIGDQAIAIH